ncbi:D-serine ammonia-lyase [Ruminococcus sp. CLA-AA-H200]|uniref:Probable D-serine dehydratase n=1 Tax=Ruminococcus turbiniformis TaxID=2881258 RepID=A0ABS8G0C0_9FIRM|nr:D-serine ammonia-lyase [Ruminococcus turbiniformis]MCC2254998.1 D-serine ammonia-lyase [Ruminococcus turbiniformis]
MNLEELIKNHPLIGEMAAGKEVVWVNPELTGFPASMEGVSVSAEEIAEAEARLTRFAPFIQACFPETEKTGGLIESPLREISAMKDALNLRLDSGIKGRLFLKMDSNLAVAGSVKARGGIYEILTFAEELALTHGLITKEDNYTKFADPEIRRFFSGHSIHVGSTGNLGLSIGIISAALGFDVYVHMSADAKQWKKDLLRSKGVHVIEYSGDYGKAVKEGRDLAVGKPDSYFVDDENSKNLFLGYAVAANRLKHQLDTQGITVDREHPLIVYIPCGVGGAPGGITFGLKQVYGDCVHVFFVEPTEACCMALGMISGLHNQISVQDIGLSGKTEADGLAVGRPSKFVGKTIRHMLSGEFTIRDEKLYRYMKLLMDTENIFIEPSSCAAFEGPARLAGAPETAEYLKAHGLASHMENAAQIVWATGGSLVPEDVRKEYYQKAEELENR